MGGTWAPQGPTQNGNGTVLLRTLNAQRRADSTVQANVAKYRITGLTSSGEVAYPPTSFPKSEQTIVSNVPVSVTQLRVELLDSGDNLLGAVSELVTVVANQSTVVDNPVFHYLATSAVDSAGEVYGSFFFNAPQTSDLVTFDQTTVSQNVEMLNPGYYRVRVNGEYMVRSRITAGSGNQEVLQFLNGVLPLPGLPYLVNPGVESSDFSFQPFRAGDVIHLERQAHSGLAFNQGSLSLQRNGPSSSVPNVRLVSVNSSSQQGNQDASVMQGGKRSTADGSKVLFESPNSNFGGSSSIYLKDLNSNSLTNLPVAGGHQCSMTPDGRYFAFATTQSLVSSDQNGLSDVYRYDSSTGAVRLISHYGNGTGPGNCDQPVISEDGSAVMFVADYPFSQSDGNSVDDLYMNRLDESDYTRDLFRWVSDLPSPNTTTGLASGEGQFDLALSSGNFEVGVFSGIPQGSTQTHVYYVNMSYSRPQVIDLGSGVNPCLSKNGLTVVYAGLDALEFADVQSDGTVNRAFFNLTSANKPSLCDDGRYVVFTTSDNRVMVLARAQISDARQVSFNLDGSSSVDGTATISGDGKTIFWNSTSSNIVSNDVNGKQDVFSLPNPLYSAP